MDGFRNIERNYLWEFAEEIPIETTVEKRKGIPKK